MDSGFGLRISIIDLTLAGLWILDSTIPSLKSDELRSVAWSFNKRDACISVTISKFLLLDKNGCFMKRARYQDTLVSRTYASG